MRSAQRPLPRAVHAALSGLALALVGVVSIAGAVVRGLKGWR
jgi:hypothetical protein